MSGGSYEYEYIRVEDIANRLMGQKPALRRAFGAHLKLVAKAMHDIEWVDSCDTAPGDEAAAIEKVLGDSATSAQLIILKAEAEYLIRELKALTK